MVSKFPSWRERTKSDIRNPKVESGRNPEVLKVPLLSKCEVAIRPTNLCQVFTYVSQTRKEPPSDHSLLGQIYWIDVHGKRNVRRQFKISGQLGQSLA